MSDELPTEERLRRIERGVQRRIDARRATAQQVRRGVAGGALTVLVIVGGFALLRPVASTVTAGAAGSAASALVPVRCHAATTTTTAEAARSGLPASALAACAAAATADRAEADPETTSGGSTTSGSFAGSAGPSTVCRADDGALHVYIGGATACRAHGMRAYGG